MPSISQANILLLTDSELSAILHLLHSVKSSPMMELETNDPMEGPSSSLLLSFEQTMVDIEKPHHHDVLCGRGVTTNRHPGNESFRSLVSLNKVSMTCAQKCQIPYSRLLHVRYVLQISVQIFQNGTFCIRTKNVLKSVRLNAALRNILYKYIVLVEAMFFR
jgi:hypothetical protein